jgi:hypothetical protein
MKKDDLVRIFEPWQPYLFAVATVLLPYIVLFGIYQPSVSNALGNLNWSALQGVEISTEPLSRFTSTISGLFSLGIANAFLRIAAVASIVMATIVLQQVLGWGWTLRIGAVVGVVSVAVLLVALGSPAKTGYIREVLDMVGLRAGASGVSFGPSPRAIDRAIAVNLLALTAGHNSLLAAFASLAWRAGPGELATDRLQARLHFLVSVTVMAAILLVCVTAVNKALAAWPQGLMTEPSQKAFGSIGTAIGYFWGTFGTIAVLCALLPPLISLRADIDSAAQTIAKGDANAQAKWKKENGFEFDLKSSLGAVITTAAPLLAGPGIDLISKLFSVVNP